MNSLWNNEEFCRDTFAESVPDEFKSDLVSRMLETRQRTRRIHVASAACAVALLFLASILLMQKSTTPSEMVVRLNAPKAAPRFAEIVRTIPLSADMVVHTREETVAIVHSAPAYDRISDEQMFELLRGRPVALVKINAVTQLEILGP